MRTRNAFWLAVIIVAAAPELGVAQDAHHWRIQYGPRAGLLGGALVGSADDISASFYNPGGLALAKDLPFALSTQVFEASTLTLEDGAGRGLDLDTSQSGVLPSLIGGRISAGFLGKTVVTYSILTRVRGGGETILPVVLDEEDLVSEPDVDGLLAFFRFDSLFAEHWGGLSFARPLGKRFGLGASVYLTYRTHKRLSETISQGVLGQELAVSGVDVSGFDLTSLRTVFKLGAMAKFDKLSLGATVTPPSLRLAGSGQGSLLLTSLGRDSTQNVVAASVQDGLRADFRSPLSVGFGGALNLGKIGLHASGEWFDDLPRYAVMTAEPFVPQTGGEALTREVAHALKSVVNFAVGLEAHLGESTRGYVSFHQDRSAANLDADPDIGLSTYNIKLATVGADFRVGEADERKSVTLGVTFAWGNQPASRLTDLVGEGDPQLRYQAVRFLFGFSN